MNTATKRLHRRIGLCTECHSPATHGSRCLKHYLSHRGRIQRQQQKRKEEGRCLKCGTPLHEDMDEGYVKCLFCRENIRKEP